MRIPTSLSVATLFALSQMAVVVSGAMKTKLLDNCKPNCTETSTSMGNCLQLHDKKYVWRQKYEISGKELVYEAHQKPTTYKSIGDAMKLFAAVYPNSHLYIAVPDPQIVDHTEAKDYYLKFVSKTAGAASTSVTNYFLIHRGESLNCHMPKEYYDQVSGIEFAVMD